MLLERAAGTTRSLAGAGDLGTWRSPKDPTLGRRAGDVWMLRKTVSDLDAPARYRFRVTFRWLGVHGTVLATAVRDSGSCTQRELRPDLLVRGTTVTDITGAPARQRYTADIADAGATAAGPFAVLFTPGDGSASADPHAGRRRRPLRPPGLVRRPGVRPGQPPDGRRRLHRSASMTPIVTTTR